METARDNLPVAIVAETDDETRMLIKSLLELLGFVVVETSNEEDVYESAVFYRPDLILIELTTPIVAPFSTIRRIKKEADLGRIPIIAMSSKRVSNRQLALAAGCSAHVCKPIELEQLESVVESLITCDRLTQVSVMVH